MVADLQRTVGDQVTLPPGYSLGWSGQFEYLERAGARLAWVIPIALAIIFILIWTVFRDPGEVAIILRSLPLALVGGLWLIWLLGHAGSVATLIGFIALGGLAAEFGVITLVYLRQAWSRRPAAGPPNSPRPKPRSAGRGPAMRPKAMTVAVILAGCSRSSSAKVPARKSCSASPPPWSAA